MEKIHSSRSCGVQRGMAVEAGDLRFFALE
jgi:hypothetical protein